MKKNRLFMFLGILIILLICILNKRIHENGESVNKTENAYMEAYEAYLRSFPELNDYKYSSVALRDLDKNGVPELIIVQVDEVDGILEVREKRLIYENLWYIDRTGASPYQSEVSNNKELISESMNIFSADDYMGNILDTVLINDDNINKMFK